MIDEAFCVSLIAPGMGIVGMIIVAYLSWSILKEETGTPRMQEIASYVQQGMNAFIKREFTTITVFIAILAVFITLFTKWPALNPLTALAFIYGSVLSLCAAFIGMRVAVRANVSPRAKVAGDA
jgi:K(+)-stimulated pyrophosphate-energized sodium pump